MWAESVFGTTASHPAGVDTFGQSRKDMWPSPEGTAPPIPEENNPLVKLLCEAATTQGELLNDRILMTNKVNIDVRSDFCWKNRFGEKYADWNLVRKYLQLVCIYLLIFSADYVHVDLSCIIAEILP